MAQFDLYKNPRRGEYPLLLDVQSDTLARIDTRVVVPLTTAKNYDTPISRLNPVVAVGRVRYVLVFQELAAVPTGAWGETIGSLVELRADVVAAIDLRVMVLLRRRRGSACAVSLPDRRMG